MNNEMRQLVKTQRELAEAITRQAFAIEALATAIQQQQQAEDGQPTHYLNGQPVDMSKRHAGL